MKDQNHSLPKLISRGNNRGFKSSSLVITLFLLVLSVTNCGKNRASSEKLNDKDDKQLLQHRAETRNHKSEGISNQKKTNHNIEERYAKIQQIVDSKKRFEDLRKLLRDTACNGMFDDAFRFARECTGPGSDRLLLFSDIFSSANIPTSDLLDLYRSLHDENERLGATYGLSKPGQFGTSHKNLIEINYKDEGLSSALMISLTRYAGISYDLEIPSKIDRARADAVLEILGDLLKEGKLDKNVATEAISRIGFKDPSVAFSYLANNQINIDKSIVAGIVRAQTEASPNETLSLMISGQTPLLEGYLHDAFGTWLSKDGNAAKAWLNENRSNLSTRESDELLYSQAIFSTSTRSYEDAWKAVESISDPVQRKQTESKVWTAQRDSLRNEVGKDPSGTMQAIVTDQSKYAEYWIEEAMATWVAKDFDKAEEWYEQNWKSLPVSKAQFVAAAFAKQAANQGDTATARQWATHIQDKKTRDRINSVIDKAESQPKP